MYVDEKIKKAFNIGRVNSSYKPLPFNVTIGTGMGTGTGTGTGTGNRESSARDVGTRGNSTKQAYGYKDTLRNGN